MIPAAIYSISDQGCYTVQQEGLMRTDVQVFLVDLGTVCSRAIADGLFTRSRALPQPFDQHPTNKLMYANPIQKDQMLEAPNIWSYKVTWKTITDITQTIKDPTLRPALITTGTFKLQDDPRIDFNGKALATTAGEPIDFSYQRSYPSFTIEKKIFPYPSQFGADRDFINNDAVNIYGTIYPPLTLFCPDIQISPLQWEGPYAFYDFTCTIYANTKVDVAGNIIGWRDLRRNAGYHERSIIGYRLANGKGAIYKNREDAPQAMQRSIVPVYAFTAITFGEKGALHYPSSPVLLTPQGTAYREITDADKEQAALDGTKPADIVGTGPVIGLAVSGQPVTTSGITQKQWNAAIVEAQLKVSVSFNDYFSFAITDNQYVPGSLAAATVN